MQFVLLNILLYLILIPFLIPLKMEPGLCYEVKEGIVLVEERGFFPIIKAYDKTFDSWKKNSRLVVLQQDYPKTECPDQNFFKANNHSPTIGVAILDLGITNEKKNEFNIKLSRKISTHSKEKASENREHASRIASIISNFTHKNKEIEKVSYKVDLFDFDIYGTDPAEDSILGFFEVLQNPKIKIINYSLTGYLKKELEIQVIKDLQKNGVILVVAAGNDRLDLKDFKSYPCRYDLDNVICVGALDFKENKSSITNYGEGIRVYAKSMDESTSFATPKVTRALAALWIKYPHLNYQEIIKKLPLKNKGSLSILDEEELIKILAN